MGAARFAVTAPQPLRAVVWGLQSTVRPGANAQGRTALWRAGVLTVSVL